MQKRNPKPKNGKGNQGEKKKGVYGGKRKNKNN
jgi:hypothetical protein